MSKIMSIFEKLNLVEKINQGESDSTYKKDVDVEEEILPKNIEEEKKEETQSPVSRNENVISPEKSNYKQYNEAKPQQTEPQSNSRKAADKPDFKQNDKMTIQEIYSSYGIENSNINTVFMLGNFIDALPESLPYEVRKKSVISILESSNSNLAYLLDDGKKRMDVLNQFSANYHDTTTNIVDEYKKEITELKKMINSFEEQIRINQTLLKEQNNIIKFETDKLKSIISFFNNGE